MSEEDFEDDLQDDEDLDDSNVDEIDEMEIDEEPAVAKQRKSKKSQRDEVEELSVAAKAREREMLARQMEEFFSRGGQVQEVESNRLGDPPRKPEGKYGSRPI